VLVNRGQANGILHTYVQIYMCIRNSWNVNAEARATNPSTEADWLHYFKSSEIFQVSVAVLNSLPFVPHYLYSSCNIIKTINSMSIRLVRCAASLRHLR